MLTRTTQILAIAILVSSAVACQMDAEPEELNRRDTFVPTSSESLLESRFSGLVLDDFATPIEGALVGFDSLSAPIHTDASGRFEIEIDAGIHDLTIDAAGYMRAYDRVNVSPYQSDDEVFSLTAADFADSFANTDGAALVIGDAQLTLPPNGFRHADGSQVTGTIDVVAAYHPDSQMGIAEDGSDLRIFASVDVEFYADGELVNLAAGQYAEVEIPVDESILDTSDEEHSHEESAPEDISAYYFDTLNMEWVEDGYGTLLHTDNGLVWRARLAHFTKWGFGHSKVEVCHLPPGNPENYFIIEVATPALLNAHLDHGDWEVSVEICDDIDNDCDGELNEGTCGGGSMCVQLSDGSFTCLSN